MRNLILGWTGLVLALTLSGCDCSGTSTVAGPCQRDNAPPECGDMCGATDPCPNGFYCSVGACTADCLTNADCASGTCGPDGRCIGGSMDAGIFDGARDSGNALPDGERPDRFFLTVDTGNPEACSEIEVTSDRSTPNVIFIIDQSSSMDEHIGGDDRNPTRWEVLEAALIGANGVVPALEDEVRFGYVMYSWNGRMDTSCPQLTTVPANIRNAATIASDFAMRDTINNTPTGESINAIVANIGALNLDPDEPTVFVLATDGDPDSCADPDSNGTDPPRDLAVQAVASALSAGYRTFVLAVERDINEGHLQDLANAGVTHDPGTDAPYWIADNAAELEDALQAIVGGVVSCDVTLRGQIDPADACRGTVRLGGRMLTCNTDFVVEPAPTGMGNRLRILGSACDDFRSMGGNLTATFPCDVVIVPF